MSNIIINNILLLLKKCLIKGNKYYLTTDTNTFFFSFWKVSFKKKKKKIPSSSVHLKLKKKGSLFPNHPQRKPRPIPTPNILPPCDPQKKNNSNLDPHCIPDKRTPSCSPTLTLINLSPLFPPSPSPFPSSREKPGGLLKKKWPPLPPINPSPPPLQKKKNPTQKNPSSSPTVP